MADRFRAGSNYVICDRCGFKKRATQCVKDWNGLFVCEDDWDGRQPQDSVRGLRDNQTPNQKSGVGSDE